MTGLLDIAGQEIRVGDFVGCAKGFTIRIARVVEIKDTLDERPGMKRWRFRIKLRGYQMRTRRVQKAAWLERIHGRLLRLESHQVPDEAKSALGLAPGGLAALEREQQRLLRRLTEIDDEMGRLPGDDDSHIAPEEVFGP